MPWLGEKNKTKTLTHEVTQGRFLLQVEQPKRVVDEKKKGSDFGGQFVVCFFFLFFFSGFT